MEVLGGNDQRCSLVPVHTWLQEQMITHPQGADEPRELYIARLQHFESELCMVSEDPKAVHASLTMELVSFVKDDYGMAVTMIKNFLLSSYSGAPDAKKWMYVVSALREEEHLCLARGGTRADLRATRETEHGYSAFPRRPHGDVVHCAAPCLATLDKHLQSRTQQYIMYSLS